MLIMLRLQVVVSVWHLSSAHCAWRCLQVSLHCVKAYGHLQEELSSYRPAECATRVMLHSYGGSPEQVPGFAGIGGDAEDAIGKRIYFSFSAAIARKTPEKTLQRIAAVPDDRVLVETDLEDASGMNDALAEITVMVAKAKDWSIDQAVEQTWANYQRFYDGYINN